MAEGLSPTKKMTGEDELHQSSVKMRFPIFIFSMMSGSTALALTADPIASLVDTAFIGQIGAVELAAVGVSIALFNQVSRVAIFPLVSVTTSFVAEEDTIGRVSSEARESDYMETGSCVDTENNELIPRKDMIAVCDDGPYRVKTHGSSFDVDKFEPERRHIPSASSALVIGGILGLLQAIFLISGAKPLLNFMGIGSVRLAHAKPCITVLDIKVTRVHFLNLVAGDVANIILDPIFMFVFRLGVSGATIAHVISQYLMSVILLWKLMSQVDLLPPSLRHLHFGRFLKNGLLLLIRVMAVTFCITLSASMAARLGSTSMAAFQAILASSFAKKDYEKATTTVSRVLQLGLVLGLILAVVLGGGLSFGAKLFTKDADVLCLSGTGIPFVAATQLINSLAFVFDGVNFGASDFAYSAFSLASSCSNCQHYMFMFSLLQSLIHRTLDCFDDIHESSSLGWILEDRDRKRALEVSRALNVV
ncbi:MATE efflux family protein 1 [Hibiscus syriacus]|uniref:Protein DETOXIFICATION n=1 Tax=Hibiscus syriacus TaxID=106335 RepID=A0A6A3CI14_HIBSY|nr:MATE efflux family protein 1 [Hibiscus syriacus]